MIEIVRQNANDINLNQDLYAKAYDNYMSLSSLLELIDPSAPKDQLDAFERQLMRFGIRTKNDPKSGTGASMGEMFFQSNLPASRILFPEFLNRIARVAVMAQDDIESQLVASTETLVGTSVYRAIYIDDTAAQRATYRVSEMGKFPVTKISWLEKATTLAKYGVALEMSYEFVRRSSIPIITLLIQRIMLQRRAAEISQAIAVLYAGDGSGTVGGAGAIAVTELKDDIQGGAPAGTEDLEYTSWLTWLCSFYPGMCTTVIGCADDIIKAYAIAAPSIFPIYMTNFIDQSKLQGVPRLINGRVPGNVNFVIHDDVVANDLIGIDNRYALIGYREAGADLTETNKIINGQWDEIVLSNTIGYQCLFASARNKLLTTGDK